MNGLSAVRRCRTTWRTREHLLRYHLTLKRVRVSGMKLFAGEMAIRACLTDLLWTPRSGALPSANYWYRRNTEVSQRLQSLLPDFLIVNRLTG